LCTQRAVKQLPHIHPCLEPGCQQIQATELAVQKQGVNRRNMPKITVQAHEGAQDAMK
jgi:hypothetical protein